MQKLALKYVVMVLVIVLLTAGVVGGGLYWSLQAGLTALVADGAERALSHAKLLGEMNQMLLILGPFLLVGVGAASLYILRKVAAPEHALDEALKALADGDLTRVPETGGELTLLVKRLNEATHKLGGQIREEHRRANDVLTTAGALLQELERLPGKDKEKQRLQELARTLLDQLDQLQILITRYKLPG